MPLPSLVGAQLLASLFMNHGKFESLSIFWKPLKEVGKLVLECFKRLDYAVQGMIRQQDILDAFRRESPCDAKRP